jgi:hypothetical protein
MTKRAEDYVKDYLAARNDLGEFVEPHIRPYLRLHTQTGNYSTEGLDFEFIDVASDGIIIEHAGSYNWNSYRITIPFDYLDDPETFTKAAHTAYEARLKRAHEMKTAQLKGSIERLKRELAQTQIDLNIHTRQDKESTEQ